MQRYHFIPDGRQATLDPGEGIQGGPGGRPG